MLRLFIAIDLPNSLKNRLEERIIKFKPKLLKARFTPMVNWHLTITFLGAQESGIVENIETAMHKLETWNMKHGLLEIEFDKLIYGPINSSPRMIWLTTTKKTSILLGKLKKQLEDELELNSVRWRRESRPFQGHLTLARFEPRNIEHLPIIDQIFTEKFQVNSLNLMKSNLSHKGAVHELIFKSVFA